MRQDLPIAFQAAAAARSRRPRQLLVFHFPLAGDVYLSDQALGPADGLANTYLPLVEDWGTLQDVAGDATSADPGIIRQLSISLWNGGAPPFSDYFLAEPPEDVEVSLYQWFVGLDESDKILLDRFVVQDPIEFNESSRLLRLDLVGLPIRWDQPVGQILKKDDWPHADPGDIGRGIPVVLGSPGQIPTIKARVALACTLANSILATDITIPVNEDLGELGWPTSGSLQLDEEVISHSGRTASSLTGCTRGVGASNPDQHLRNAEIVESISDHTFLLCEGPVAAIDKVQIDGYPAPAGIYSVYPALNPARIVFNQQPYYERFSSGSKFLEMQFDSVGSGNTAVDAINAFDTDMTATTAKITVGKALVLKQDTVNEDRGQILKAYLSVAHWESGEMGADYIRVDVSGVGTVGRLARPNPDDDFTLTADVDLDHGHQHRTGAAHSHTYTDPDFDSTSPGHDHNLSINISEIRTDIGSFPIGEWIEKSGSSWTTDYITFPEYDSNQGVWVQYSLSYNSAAYVAPIIELVINLGGTTYYIPFDSTITGATVTVYIGAGAHGSNPYIRYRSTTGNASYFCLISCALIWHATNAVSTKVATVTTTKTTAGSSLAQGADVHDVPIKASDDVVSLATANQPLNINAQTNPSRTIVDLFDLTGNVNFNWAWFTGRTVTLTYVSNGANRTVHVLHMFFEIEFAPREVVFSDAVTARVSGLISGPSEALTFLLQNKAGVAPEVLAASFAEADATYSGLGYRLDGLLDADMTVQEACRKICLQTHSRLLPDGGQIGLVVKSVMQTPVRSLTKSDLQLKSINVSRRPMPDVKNSIDLAYDYDWKDGNDFRRHISVSDARSVERFGGRQDRDSYQFDLIASEGMARAVANYYLFLSAWPNSYYRFNLYLPHIALGSEDCIALSADFHGLANTTMVIRAINRQFGSGKLGRINLLQVVAEAIAAFVMQINLEDALEVTDSLEITMAQTMVLEDALEPSEELAVDWYAVDTLTLGGDADLILEIERQSTEGIAALELLVVEVGIVDDVGDLGSGDETIDFSNISLLVLEDSLDPTEELTVDWYAVDVFMLGGDADLVVEIQRQSTEGVAADESLVVELQWAFDAIEATDDLVFDSFAGYGRSPYGQAPYGS